MGGRDFSSHSFTCRLPPTSVFANYRPVYGELLDEHLVTPSVFLFPLFQFMVNV